MASFSEQQQLINDLVNSLATNIEISKWEQQVEASENPQTLFNAEQIDERMLSMLSKRVSSFNMNIKGCMQTDEAFIFEHFDFADSETTTDGIVNCEKARSKLMSYGIFKDVLVEVDRGEEYGSLDVNVEIDEKDKLFAGSIGAETSNNEVLGKAGWGLRNIGGRAESLTMEVSGGGMNEDRLSMKSMFMTTKKFMLNFTKPRILSTDRTLVVSAFHKGEDHTRNSSYMEKNQGLTASVIEDEMRHRWGYNCEFRMVEPTARNETSEPSPSVHNEGREPSLKSSIFYAYTDDSREDLPVPSSGSLKNFSVELAGLGGNVEFLKAQSVLSYHMPIGFGTFNLGLNTGVIAPLSKLFSGFPRSFSEIFQDKRTRINDRLQIPGRLLLRGYQHGKIGDRDKDEKYDDYLNGDAMYAAGASYSFPIAQSGLAGHLFATAGNVKRADYKASWQENITKMINESRISLGFSVVIPFAIGRLEFGMAVPFNQHNDHCNPLFWGLDVNFL